MHMVVETRLVSSLAKVFPDEPLQAAPVNRLSMMKNEVLSFQLAWCGSADVCGGVQPRIQNVQLAVRSPLSAQVQIRKVSLIPSDMPAYADPDTDVLRCTPGLFPDLLEPVGPEGLTVMPGQWRSAWISIEPDPEIPAGEYILSLQLHREDGSALGSEILNLSVIDALLPAQTLQHTQWFHGDCIASWYKDAPLSEAHWQRMEQYLRMAADHGINMILTPLFTLPLDTAVGGERPTLQLVQVIREKGVFRFDFTWLDRWLNMCDRCGIDYLEMSHLFTQWGARHAPKIMGLVDGVETQLFGWDTDATGPEYAGFLRELLPEVCNWADARGIRHRCVFHASDEPAPEHMDSYRHAVTMIRGLVPGFRVIDALSDPEFFKQGLVQIPVPANDHIGPFLELNLPERWTYYCCSQYRDVSNRFFCMPSGRNRILGYQLWKFNMDGFLHWGYNFWYSQYSRRMTDPFRESDAGFAFPSGDAFLVYPGPDGPLASIRLEVTHEALQDMRALALLESLTDRRQTLDWLEDGLEAPLSFSCYPREDNWILRKRESLNQRVSALLDQNANRASSV